MPEVQLGISSATTVVLAVGIAYAVSQRSRLNDPSRRREFIFINLAVTVAICVLGALTVWSVSR